MVRCSAQFEASVLVRGARLHRVAVEIVLPEQRQIPQTVIRARVRCSDGVGCVFRSLRKSIAAGNVFLGTSKNL